jgi:type IV pilus assembly protein PilA
MPKRNRIFIVFKSNSGFTLIELLIVVAVIGILAAIAIPEYSTYRMKGFNVAAQVDLRNFKSAMEAYYMEHSIYP